MAPLLIIDPTNAAVTALSLPYDAIWNMGVDEVADYPAPYYLLLGVNNYGGTPDDWRRVALDRAGVERWNSGSNTVVNKPGSRRRAAYETSYAMDHDVLYTPGSGSQIQLLHIDYNSFSIGSHGYFTTTIPLVDGSGVDYSSLHLYESFTSTNAGWCSMWGMDGAGAPAAWDVNANSSPAVLTKKPLVAAGRPKPVGKWPTYGTPFPLGTLYTASDAKLRHCGNDGSLRDVFDFSAVGGRIIAATKYQTICYLLLGADGGTSFNLYTLWMNYDGTLGTYNLVGAITTPQPLRADTSVLTAGETGTDPTRDPITLFLTDASWTSTVPGLTRLPDQAHVAEVRGGASLRPSSRVA